MTTAQSLSAETAPPRVPVLFQPVWIVLICALALSVLGLTILFSSTAGLRADPYFFLKRQVIWLGAAVAAGWLVSRLDLEYFRRYAWILAGVALAALFAVLIPHVGVTVNGARRWVDLGFSRLQPSEFGKIAMVFALCLLYTSPSPRD